MALSIKEHPEGIPMTTKLRLSANLDADPQLLGRILSVCCRRRLRIDELHYDDGRAEVLIAVSGPVRQARQLPLWLDRLAHTRVEVLSTAD